MDPKRILSSAAALLLPLAVLACGGGEQAGQQTNGEQAAAPQQGQQQQQGGQQAGQQAPLTTPDWMSVDSAGESVTLQIRAGSTDANNSWNFNGYFGGDGTIVVPEGWEVTVEFSNEDQVNAHSFSIENQVGDYPPTFEQATPVFEGAASSSPTEMAGATQPGQSETVTFTATKTGDYAMVCLVPAHATQGMWVRFNVSGDGAVGFREPA